MVSELRLFLKAVMSAYKFSNPIRIAFEKFDGRISFGLWQLQVKDVLIQSTLHKALKGKLSSTSIRDSKKSIIMSDGD